MREIALTQGKITLVNDEDFMLLNMVIWQAHKQPNKTIADNWLAGHAIAETTASPSKTIFMHRFIMGAGVGQVVDHIDADGLNNQKYNLRICTALGNNRNSTKQGGTTSKYKGVSYHKKSQKWQVQIVCGTRNDGKRNTVFLGHYISEEEAATMYDFAAKFYFGEFAKCNFS